MSNERQTQQEEKKAVKKSSLDGVVVTNPGNHIQPVYKRVYDKKLDKNIVKKVDTFDIQEFIQASKSQTDMALLQKRFVELGEVPAADPSLGDNDLVGMPSDIHGVYAMVNDVNANFQKLPESIRNIFGTKEAYLEAILKGTYQSTLINALNASNAPKEEKKQESEEK